MCISVPLCCHRRDCMYFYSCLSLLPCPTKLMTFETRSCHCGCHCCYTAVAQLGFSGQEHLLGTWIYLLRNGLSERHPILYRGFKFRFFGMANEPCFCADSLAFVLLNNTACVTVCMTTCVLSRSRHSVLLWHTFVVWVISLSIW